MYEIQKNVDNFILRLLKWCASRFFGFMTAYAPEDREVKAIFFAKNEREMNSACRDYVDQLDEEYKKG